MSKSAIKISLDIHFSFSFPTIFYFLWNFIQNDLFSSDCFSKSGNSWFTKFSKVIVRLMQQNIEISDFTNCSVRCIGCELISEPQMEKMNQVHECMSAFDGHGQTNAIYIKHTDCFWMFINERYNLLVFRLHHMVKLQSTGRCFTTIPTKL